VNREAVVLGLETNGLGVVRALGRAGVAVLGLSSDPGIPTARSRYCRVLRVPDERTPAVVDRLVELGRIEEAPRPLFLTMELSVAIASRHRERLAPYYLFNLPEPEQLAQLNDKARFARIAGGLGLHVPRTEPADGADALLAAARRVGFPLIVKPLEKNGRFDAVFKARALCFDDEHDLIARFAGFPWGQGLLVQQFIAGADRDIWFCLAYCDRHGEPRAHFTGRKLRVWPPATGNTASALPAAAPEVTEATLALFRAVGMRGLASLEFKREPLSGDFYVIEPTIGRTDYQSGVAPANGVNIPHAAYLDLLGRPVPVMSPSPVPVLWVDRVNDARAAAAAVTAGRATADDIRRSLPGPKVYALRAADDPWPYAVDRYKAVLLRVKRLLLWLLDRMPGLYVFFTKVIPPDLRWPPQEIMDSLKRHEEPRRSFVAYFTRDPQRRVPREPRIIVSPADGVVRNVLERGGRRVIDISMNFYDVHVQRVPIDGVIQSVEESGRRVEAGSEDERRYFVDPWEYERDYLFPVQVVVRIDSAIGEVVVRQISSIWARRIATFVKPGDRVVMGQRLGHILFGSTAVLELPLTAEVVVEPLLKTRRRQRGDQPVKGGETIVARY
jgi:D-aspartate ligase